MTGRALLPLLALLVGCSATPAREPNGPIGNAAPASASAQASSGEPAKPALPQGMVLVPPGPFLRGSVEGVGLRDEHPQRKIDLDAFFIDQTEVTQAAYAKCVEAKACVTPRCKKDRPTDWDPEARAAYPVVCIDWEEARAYCSFVGKRLPTEAEWEKAARGTEGALYPWGNAEPTCDLANYSDCDRGGPAPVGSYPKNKSPYGALDMAGNVWEWVADYHLASYYNASPDKNPEGPFEGDDRVVRGGSFKYDAELLLSAERTYDEPTVHYEHIGVRCARDAR
ncbi:MAG: formylglycine-generating enzyme family protein [Polyangiaceae bacterium]